MWIITQMGIQSNSNSERWQVHILLPFFDEGEICLVICDNLRKEGERMGIKKYEEWTLDEDKLLLLSGWARDGLTDDQIAKNVGVSRSTLSEWKRKYKVIADALKKGKEVVDIEVENALLKRAKGYTACVNKNYKRKIVKYDPATGKKVSEEEVIETRAEETHIPPDTTAIIFWLKNRRPDKWRDRRTEEQDDDVTENKMIVIAQRELEEDASE